MTEVVTSPDFKFRSDTRVFARTMLRPFLIVGAVVLAIALIQQLRDNEFPNYGDFIGILIAVIAIFIGLCGLVQIAAFLWPVTLTVHGLRCYEQSGRYQTIAWSDIREVEWTTILGLPYLYLMGDELEQPLTLPLWLNGMARLVIVTRRLAGNDHVLTLALEAFLAGKQQLSRGLYGVQVGPPLA